MVKRVQISVRPLSPSLNHRAFTLIEMLAVIAIGATLLILLSGNLGTIFRSSQKTTSISNIRQITLALNSFAGDNDGYYPYSYYWNKKSKVERTYVTELLPFLSSGTNSINGRNHKSNIFISPATTKSLRSDYETYIPYTYALHGVLCPDANPSLETGDPGSVRMKNHAVARPSQVILVGDSSQKKTDLLTKSCFENPPAFVETGRNDNLGNKIPVGGDVDTGNGGYLRYRYNGYATVGMVDGHVEMIKKGEVTFANITVDR